nr:MAG: TetR/AcrR family transcriptional regulator [Bacillota bacterium]
MPRVGRKEQILAAATALFARKGYHATTVRDIAEEAGMLSGSLYAHIDTKQDLLVAVVERAAEAFTEAVVPIARSGLPPGEKIRAAMRAHVRVVAESREAATVFMHEWRALDEERRQAALALRDRYEALWDGMIREGIASGEFRPVDPKFARLLLLSAANWIYQWYNPDGPLGPDEVADRFTDLILNGLRPEPRAEGSEPGPQAPAQREVAHGVPDLRGEAGRVPRPDRAGGEDRGDGLDAR